MKKSRRKFKSQVAIEAIKERESLVELSKRFELHPNQIYQWKREFLEHADQVFAGSWSAPNTSDIEKERDRLHPKIGELKMDRNFLKKV